MEQDIQLPILPAHSTQNILSSRYQPDYTEIPTYLSTP